ncbi:MAG: hypothetical protein JWQ09_4047 [Segetibacter sp.]|nr:hypothetical protein [Segetibacter sp.]
MKERITTVKRSVATMINWSLKAGNQKHKIKALKV